MRKYSKYSSKFDVRKIHQIIVNLVHTFELQNKYLDEDDPWSGILAGTAFARQNTYHTKSQATPIQLVLGRDMIIDNPFNTDWEYIRRCKKL